MDAFKRMVLVSLVVTLIALGFVFYVASSSIANGNIPDSESGVVLSKSPVTDGKPAMYSVSLDSGKVLYIESNSTLYDELVVGTRYMFTCRIVYLSNIIVIDSAVVPQTENSK